MLNVVVADDSLHYVQGLINHVFGRHSNIKIVHVASNGLEVLNLLKEHENIDLIQKISAELSYIGYNPAHLGTRVY